MSWQNLTTEQLQALPTHRLLQVYKRQRTFTGSRLPHCGCPYNCYTKDDATEAELAEWEKQKAKLAMIKQLLDDRGHVGADRVNENTKDPKLKPEPNWSAWGVEPIRKRVGPIADPYSAIGKQVVKLSKKPFKSKLLYNTVTGVTKNPHTNNVAFTFDEDTSVVDVNMCNMRPIK